MNNSPLANQSFRRLFAAQIFSLVGMGLLTVAISLAAYRIGGTAKGGQLLGLFFALKMLTYVFLAPLAETLLVKSPRKSAMASLDLGRMLLLVAMALVTETWQFVGLSFVFFVLAAGFTPLFQSVIPDILPEKTTYTKALAWSQIAYTLEVLLSAIIAALVINLVTGELLFYAAAVAFFGSLIALLSTRFPSPETIKSKGSFLKRAGRGLWIYQQTPRLQGVFLLNLALSLVMAWLLVNSVVYAGVRMGDAEQHYSLLMSFYGIGAVLGAAFAPQVLRKISERSTMLSGTFGFAVVGAGFALFPSTSMPLLASVWAAFGFASSLIMAPGALVITRSAKSRDHTSVFAAQFSLSHAGWLISYPLVGWLAAYFLLELALFFLSAACTLIAKLAMKVWPAIDPLKLQHNHPELPDDHQYLKVVPVVCTAHQHAHDFYIDELHPICRQG
jgi:MFS family permease